MQITVFGATGGTGREFVRQAADAGHEVTAVVRDPARLPVELAARVRVVKAEIRDAAALEKAVQGSDAVVSAVGTRDLSRPDSVCADTARAAIAAIRATGGEPRLVITSNTAMAPGPGDDPLARYVVKPLILARVLRHTNADMREAEEIVRASGLPWTIVRSGRLTDHAAKGRYRRAIDRNVFGGYQITRADFATSVLDATTDPAMVGHVLSVSN